MNYKKKISTDVIITGIVKLGSQFQGLILIPLISKPLGLDTYGAYVQVIAITGLAARVLHLDLHAALIRYGQEDSQDISDLYYSLTSFALGCGVVVAFMIAVFGKQITQLTLGTTQYAETLLIGTLLIPLKVLTGMSRNYFRVEMQVKMYSLAEGIKSYLYVAVIAVTILWLGLGLPAVITSLVIAEMLVAGTLQFIVGRRIGYTIPSYTELERSLRYSIPLTFSTIADQLSKRGDRLLVGYFLGASAVGIYSIGYSVASFMTTYSGSVYTSFFPEISRLIETGKEKMGGNMIKTGIRYFIIIAVPSAVGLYLVGPRVVRFISNTEAANATEPLIPVIAAGIIFHGLDTLLAIVPTVKEATLAVSKIRMMSAIVNIGLNIVLIPVYGIAGAAGATLLAYGLSAVLLYYKSNKMASVPLPWSITAKTIISSGVMFAVGFYLLDRQFIVTLITGPMVYFGVLIMLGGISVSEVRNLLGSGDSQVG